ncbi:MAG: hypothetical protein JST75_06965 [Bacteroidetes bacterium]|nr:hypothetical protein [Bacteroidota bacterium]
MKRILLPIFFAVFVLASCSTYKNSQTPDDVYYSPGVSNVDGSQVASNSNNNDYYSTQNDQYVHMRVQNPDKWSYFDDYNSDYYGAYSPMGYGGYNPYFSPYYGSSFSLGFGYMPWVGFGYWGPMSYWNSYYSWNSFYNPYYGGVIVVNPKLSSSTDYTHLRTFNPSSYTNTGYYNRKAARGTTSNGFQNYSYSQTIRSNYSSGNNGSYSRPVYNRPTTNNNYAQPNRTYSPSFGGGSSGGGRVGGGGGGGGISRPHR